MPTPREYMPRRGSFAQQLLVLYEEPTFDHLMHACTLADPDNYEALSQACTNAGLLPTEQVSLVAVHRVWWRTIFNDGLPAALEAEFPVLARLDEEMPEPWMVPLRGQAPPTDLTADELTGCDDRCDCPTCMEAKARRQVEV